MQFKMKQVCPCCNKEIGFFDFYKSWTKASKLNEKFIRCFYCSRAIGEIKAYNKYAAFMVILLFAIPLVGIDRSYIYIFSFFILFMIFIFIWFLYRFISFKCYDQEVIEDERSEYRKNEVNPFILSLVLIGFLVAIIWIMMSFAYDIKEQKRHENLSSCKIESFQVVQHLCG